MKYKVLRTILFFVAFAVAVIAITQGVLAIGHKDPGWQSVSAQADAQAPLYSSDYTFQYYAQGTSNQIKAVLREVTPLYSQTLARAYKLTDSANTYDGYVNLATLNQSNGEAVVLEQELFDIICDAWDRTNKKEGYNMFAGPLYSEWYSILGSDNAPDFDPLFNDYQAQRIKKLAEAVSDYSNFRFEIVDSAQRIVRFSVSEQFKSLLKELELDVPVLDLNVLRDAYILDLIRKVFVSQNLNQAQMYSKSGMAFSLVSKQSSALVSVLPLNESDLYYYSIQKDGVDYLRHPHFDTRTGDFHNNVLQVVVRGKDYEIKDVAYAACMVENCDTDEQVALVCSVFEADVIK